MGDFPFNQDKTEPQDLSDDGGHEWQLHFVPDEVDTAVKNEFATELDGKEIKHLLRKVDTLMSNHDR